MSTGCDLYHLPYHVSTVIDCQYSPSQHVHPQWSSTLTFPSFQLIVIINTRLLICPPVLILNNHLTNMSTGREAQHPLPLKSNHDPGGWCRLQCYSSSAATPSSWPGSCRWGISLPIDLKIQFSYQIVFSKLRERTAMDHDRRHLKAAKVIYF